MKHSVKKKLQVRNGVTWAKIPNKGVILNCSFSLPRAVVLTGPSGIFRPVRGREVTWALSIPPKKMRCSA